MTERGGTREGLSIREQSRKIVEGVPAFRTILNDVATAVKKSYTDLPTSEAAVGTKESKALTTARKQMTVKLLVLRDVHLLEMGQVVKNLERTLGYFKQDYDTFKNVVRFARPVLKKSEEHALFVKKIFVELAVELVKLGEDAKEALKAAEAIADGQLASAMNRADFAKAVENKVAVGMGVTGVAVTMSIGGIGLAIASLGPAGLLFATVCAIPAIFGSSAAGVIGATAVGAAATALKKDASQRRRVVDVIGEAGKVYDTFFVHVLKEFAECTGGFAGIFHSIASQLDIVISDGASVPDEALRSIYDSIQDEKEKLTRACDRYQRHMTDARIDIGVLERFQEEDYKSCIDEWYKECPPSQRKSLRMTQELLEKAVNACAVPILAFLSNPFEHFTLGCSVREACFAVALFSFACLVASRAVGRFL